MLLLVNNERNNKWMIDNERINRGKVMKMKNEIIEL